MKWFHNIKVRSKMIVCFSAVILLMAVLATSAVIGLNSISDSYGYAIKHPIGGEIKLRIFDKSVGDIRHMTTTMCMFAVTNDTAAIDICYKEAEAALKKGLDSLEAFDQGCRIDPKLSKADLDGILMMTAELRSNINKYMNEVCVPVAAAARNGDDSGAFEHMGAGEEYVKILTDGCELIIGIAEFTANDNVSSAETTTTRTVWIVLGATLFLAVLSVLIAFFLTKAIGTPLTFIARAFNQLGTQGNLQFEPEVMQSAQSCLLRQDEIGQCARSFGGMVQHLSKIEESLILMSKSDFSVDVDILSDKDSTGLSLQKTLENLNHLFGDINSTTSQVSNGSRQIADGAQSLAAGSTQQASSVEQLSATIAEITDKTKDNADMANRAAALAGTIMKNAEEGSRHMKELTTAVSEINQASQNIQKVIKVIDDIAFQTNILALNAAVEAARAGQHGKGFAVVAEEVRNLAAKSADAAKNTSSMITDSMEKAELGSRIANETAVSLAEIVNGITESSQIISEIARSSKEQSFGITQINSGIDQVAQVIQQNSATAEQSAAASEEMSGQSAMLEELVSQFKLKNKR